MRYLKSIDMKSISNPAYRIVSVVPLDFGCGEHLFSIYKLFCITNSQKLFYCETNILKVCMSPSFIGRIALE